MTTYLTQADQAQNYRYRGGDPRHCLDDPADLIQLVANRCKPVASIVLVNYSSSIQQHILDAAAALQLCADVSVNRWGVKCAHVYWPDTTLAQYWSADVVRDAYKKAGVAPPPQVYFDTPVRNYIPGLANEEIDYELIGLLYGYPVRKTLRLLNSLH
jgi:hypothetical protein